MGNLISSEWYKLKKDRAFWVLSLILLCYSLGYPLIMQSASGVSGNAFYLNNILSINVEVIRLFPAVLAGFFISSEYSMGTMKSIVSSGNSRNRLYFSKLMVFSIGSAIIMLILPILMVVVGIISFGADVMPEWSFYLKTLGFTALYAMAFASIMAFFSTIFTDSGKSIAFQLLFFGLAADMLLEYISGKVSFLEPIITRSIFMSRSFIFTIDQMGQWSGDDVLTYLVIPIVTFIVFGILGSIVYRRKEIK